MALARHTMVTLATILAPVFAVMIAAALAGHLMQSRPVFSLAKDQTGFLQAVVDFRLQAHVRPRRLANLVKGLLKMLMVGIAIWTQLWPERGMLESMLNQTPIGVVGDMDHLLFKVLIAALAALAVHRGARLLPAALPVPAAQPHVQAGDQGRVPPERRRPADQGQDPPDPPGARQEAHDGGGARGDGGDHQPDPLCGRAEI